MFRVSGSWQLCLISMSWSVGGVGRLSVQRRWKMWKIMGYVLMNGGEFLREHDYSFESGKCFRRRWEVKWLPRYACKSLFSEGIVDRALKSSFGMAR